MKAIYECPICEGTELDESDIEGYAGMCDGCACEKMNQELEEQWEKELLIYEKRTGVKLDFNEFYFACQAGEVDKKKLRGLKELKDCYECSLDHVAEIYRPCEADAQMELNFDDKLPF